MKEKKKNIFLIMIVISFIIFIGLFIASESGYYESKLNQKVLLTDKEIKEFENDVIEGKTIDINSYIKKNKKSYENNFTILADKTTELIQGFLTKGIKDICDSLKSLFF